MFIPFSSVAIADFKQANVSWEVLFLICYSSLKCVISQMIVFFFVFFLNKNIIRKFIFKNSN